MKCFPSICFSVSIFAMLLDFSGARGFVWTASMDRLTGKAQSNEISFPSKHWSHSNSDLVDHFLCYPQWLCKGSVTLGLLKAVAADGWDVRLIGFGTSLLKLGPPVRRGNEVQFPFQGGLMVAKTKSRQGYLKFSAYDDGVIQTGIVNYRASLCGVSAPTNAVRRLVYLRTQSLVHAYVMWRFHQYCRTAESNS